MAKKRKTTIPNAKPSKAAKVTASTSPAPVPPGLAYLKGTEADTLTRLNISSRKVLVTKFFDVPTLETLGLLDTMTVLLRKVGLEGFLTRSAPTYQRFTLEFLATFQTGITGPQREKFISFRLNQTHRQLTYTQLREIFGFVGEGVEDWNPFRGHDCAIFWRAITGQSFAQGGDFSSAFAHPALRLIHRVLAMTVFGQGEPTKINKFEMSCMWAFTPEVTLFPDWIHIFVGACERCIANPSGRFGMGGMVTLLMKHFGVKVPANVAPLKGSPLLDLRTLKRLQLIQHTTVENIFCWNRWATNIGYLILPRSEGHVLPVGPNTAAFHIAADPDVARFLIPKQGNGDDSAEGNEGEGDDVSNDVRLEERDDAAPPLTWQQLVDFRLDATDDKIEELGDGVHEVLLFCRRLNNFFTGGMQPGTYAPPDPHAIAELSRKRSARDDRRAARCPTRGGPGESSGP